MSVLMQRKRYLENILFHLSELVLISHADVFDEHDHSTFHTMKTKYDKLLVQLKCHLSTMCDHEFANADIESNIESRYCIKCDLAYKDILKANNSNM